MRLPSSGKRAFAIATLLLALASVAPAQQTSKPATYSSHGYAYFAASARPGGFGEGLGFGGGAETLVYKGLGLGGEIGYLLPRSAPSGGYGLLSANPSYHFVNRKKPGKLAPFVTGGYSLAFRSGSISMFNYGGGVTYWLSEKIGLRFEVREHRRGGGILMFRTSVTFR